MEIKIVECRVSCGVCNTPLTDTHPSEKGLRINRVASLGSELVTLRERRKGAKKVQAKMLTARITDTMAEIILLGGEFDARGFIRLVD